ncbi:MAG: HAMP domain-containing histidine kinase [Synergistaceae bacterium]|nr:HAMP domain-containing histidine kinase [Synergistaceae bacterium]MBR0093881.1 HAMP domain-containing histidine kinase [Synergistaceae bacterium]
MKSKSLRRHFLALYVLLAVLSGIVVPALGVHFSVNAFRNYQIQRRQADLENLGDSLAELYEEEGGTWKRRRVMDVLRPAPQWGGMVISLLDSNGREIFTLKPLQMAHRGRNSESGNFFDESESEHLTLKLGRGKNIGRLEIERKLPTGRYEVSFITYLTRYTLAGAFIMILFACGVGYLVAGKLSRPVIKVIERTQKISRGDYDISEKISSVGIRELDDLTKGVENLARSLSGQEKLRRRLMVDVAHELRTPLTVVMTQIEAISDGILEPTPERLSVCLDEMKRLGGLIENVEALTRLEGEALEIHTEPTDMKNFLEPVIESFKPVFEKAGIKFSAELESGLSCEIDRNQFRHVIDNLLSNALRYTNEGGEVKAKLFSKDRKIFIEVSDTGIGISEKDLPNIFERFYRADESRARVTGGSGVGLAIVKAAVEAHNGTITAKSVKGEGSTFTIALS